MSPEPLKIIKPSNKALNKNIPEINSTLKGVLINTHVKNNDTPVSFDEIQDSLLIHENNKQNSSIKEGQKESSFNINKAIKPLLIGTSILIGGCFALSAILKKSSQTLLTTNSFEQLPDIAVNMNIKEEPQFAIYRAIRDPNFRNIMGAAAIFIMSGITIGCKNFVDGAKEIWLKKQSADIEKDLQENLIQVETQSFSGKLNVVNNMLTDSIKYFDKTLNKSQHSNVFSEFASFKGTNNTQNKDKNQSKKIKNIKYTALILGVLAGAIVLGKYSISNIKKTAKLSQDYANGFTEKTIDTINSMSENARKEDIPRLTELFKSICAKPDFIQKTAEKYGLSSQETSSIIAAVEESKKTIFADAPTALGGIPKKIQYYCYIDENRGHLYNWILNPENKFTKYIFTAFTISSAIGYLFKQGMNAIKEVTVLKENAKTELNLRKRLVDVEVANFQSKKKSAVTPLIDNFKKQAEEGSKSKEELKQIADNILMEIKNGPPYVYT